MAVFAAMLVGTVCGVAVLGTSLLSLIRTAKQPKKRHRASVTEILQVDMVDRGLCITATNIDCSINNLDIEMQNADINRTASDQILVPPSGGFSELFA